MLYICFYTLSPDLTSPGKSKYTENINCCDSNVAYKYIPVDLINGNNLPFGLTNRMSSPEWLSQLALMNITTWSWVWSEMSRPFIKTTWSPSLRRGTHRSAWTRGERGGERGKCQTLDERSMMCPKTFTVWFNIFFQLWEKMCWATIAQLLW